MAPSSSASSQLRWLLAPLLSLCTFAVLTGCGIGDVNRSTTGTFTLSGLVHGGQQAVVGASIQLYAAGKAGNASAATPMLTRSVLTDEVGTFNITGDYTCASADDQVYIVATGGNPGLPPGNDNPALVMMTALGPCGDLTASTYIFVNEVTTVAAAWALSPFMTAADHLGSSATNKQGIASAFLDSRFLVDTTKGQAATPPANLAAETGKLYALADALAPCVNSNGGAACHPLFSAATPSGGTAPADTLAAALNIVKHPGQNVAAVWDAINSEAPFPTTLTQAPSDWTMSLSITGGGLDYPAGLAVDAFNNIWVADTTGALSAFSPQGTPFNSSGYGIGVLNDSYGIAIDTSNKIWVTNNTVPSHSPTYTFGSVTAFLGAGSGSTGSLFNGTSYFYDASIDLPQAVAADTNGNIFIANYANGTATVYNQNGQFVQSGLGQGDSSFPSAIAADTSHGIWLANSGDDTITHVAADGTILAHPNCCNGAQGIAIDALGNAWVANYYGSSVSEVSSAGTVVIENGSNGGLENSHPRGIAIDADQNVWIANFLGSTLIELAGNGGTLMPGAGISPSTGYGIDANMLLPYSVAPDTSGNVWLADYADSRLVMFFGLAAPTLTPLGPVPTAP